MVYMGHSLTTIREIVDAAVTWYDSASLLYDVASVDV